MDYSTKELGKKTFSEHPSTFDPTSNPASKVEWWFFQGYFKINRNDHYEFMLSFFRNKPEEDTRKKDGHFILLSIHDVKNAKTFKKSTIDPLFFEEMLELVDKDENINLDKDFKDLMSKELQRKGPVKPVKINNNEVKIKTHPFCIEWDDLSIKYSENQFEIRFSFPGLNEKCSFTLRHESQLMKLYYSEQRTGVLGSMNYHSIPRMKLYGKLGKETIEGEAWTDHQWGDTGWFFSKDKNLLGWDWFGINLEDGTNLIVIKHNDFNNKKVLSKYAALQKPDGSIDIFKNFEMQETGFWESPDTRIQYPVKSTIDIKEIQLILKFYPVSNEQEIHIPGYTRAIWEGAGKVEGEYSGKKIKGRARGEFFGYGYIFDFKNYLETYSKSVDNRIEEVFPKAFKTSNVEYFVGKPFWNYDSKVYTKTLSDPVWELIQRSGKRWRPVFGILMLEALGKPAKNYERLISMIELIHTGALIIDDIQDNSPLRRGKKSIHLKYGTDVAINAGNTLYFLPSKEIFHHIYLTEKQKYKVHEIMMNTYLQSHFGQSTDIYWSKHLSAKKLKNWLRDNISAKILQMYDYKTGAGAKGIAEVAAVVAKAGSGTSAICVDFARSFAVAFQIIDDIHNFSRSEKWSKQCGEDLKIGKLTFVIAKALLLLNEKDTNRLTDIFCNNALRNSEDGLNEGIHLIQNSGALKFSRKFARNMAFTSLEKLNVQLPNYEAKIMLGMLCKRMIDLSFDT